MKVFKSILVGILSLINSFMALGIYTLSTSGDTQGGAIFGFLVVIIIMSFLITLLRGSTYVAFTTICEVILSPLAIIRFAIGVILVIVTKNEFALDLEDFGYGEDVPSEITTLLIYYEIGEAQELTPVGNFFVQLLIVLPMSALVSVCSWLLFLNGEVTKICESIGIELPQMGFFSYIIVGLILLVFLIQLGAMKTSEVDLYVPERTFFRNYNTGAHEMRYGRYAVTKASADAGWEAINQSSGYIKTKAHLAIYTIILAVFSPVLVFTQALGTIMAFIAIFTRHIYSKTGEILLEEVPLKILQAPLAVLCSFVFC